MPPPSPQPDHTKELRMKGSRKKMGTGKEAAEAAPHAISNFQSYLGQKPEKQAQPIYSSRRHATKYPTVCCSKKWKGKLSLKMRSMQHKSFTRRIHL